MCYHHSYINNFLIFCYGVLFIVSNSTHAFEVSPLVHEMTTSGLGASSRILIHNYSDSYLPLDISVNRIEFDSQAQQTLHQVEDELALLPPALFLPPGGSKTVRLQWVGKQYIKQSHSYFVSISQLPLQLHNKTSNGIRMMLSFNVLVHVAQAGSNSDLKVEKAELVNKSEMGSMLKARIYNKGNRYAYLNDMTLTINSAGKPMMAIRAGELRELGYDAFLPPNTTRKICIPIEGKKAAWKAPITLELTPRIVHQ